MATSVLPKPAAKGGSFLLESRAPEDIFTPADLTDDQKLRKFFPSSRIWKPKSPA
jgi:hypothetical protein